VEVKQMMAQMLAEMKPEIRTNQDKADANLKEIRAGQELLKEEILAKMKAKIDTNQKKMKAAIHSIWTNILSCVDQKMQGLRKELTKKIDKTLVDLKGA
jgi:F0F1-type ATP synthase membrane subunit b/b'